MNLLQMMKDKPFHTVRTAGNIEKINRTATSCSLLRSFGYRLRANGPDEFDVSINLMQRDNLINKVVAIKLHRRDFISWLREKKYKVEYDPEYVIE